MNCCIQDLHSKTSLFRMTCIKAAENCSCPKMLTLKWNPMRGRLRPSLPPPHLYGYRKGYRCVYCKGGRKFIYEDENYSTYYTDPKEIVEYVHEATPNVTCDCIHNKPVPHEQGYCHNLLVKEVKKPLTISTPNQQAAHFMGIVADAEADYEAAITDDSFKKDFEAALKGFRRALPVTRTKFDWVGALKHMDIKKEGSSTRFNPAE